MSTLITSFTLNWRGTERSMEAPICAWQGAMRSLPGKLEPLLSDPEYGLRKGEKNKIKLLKGDLQELIAKYLIEPSEVEAPALTANCWVKEVRELSYDIDDFVDKLVHVAVQRNLRGKTTKLREELGRGPRGRWVADEISGFRTRVKEAIQRHRSYNLPVPCRPSSSASDERPLPPLYGMEAVGLDSVDRKREELERWLTDERERRLSVVSILGLGGVGKTTLAKQLYCKLGRRFDCRAFVRTSRKPDIKSLLTSILLQVRRHQAPNTWDKQNLIEMIRAHLHDKKYFIIIDDLWTSSTWDIVNRALPDGNCCSRILTTTEVDIVAETCSGHNSEYIFKMEPLSDNGSRKLFFNSVFGHQYECPEQFSEVSSEMATRVLGHQYEYPERFNKVSSEIIRKCGGLPLATITAASLLASQPDRIEQWNCIQNSLSSNLRTNLTLEGVKQVLNLSYDNLPHRLKACMLYFSLYQEDYTIWKNDLVKQWIAEGFICAKEGKDMEEVARSYFDELLNRGMIQPVHINYNGEAISCTVHHMVLNLIRYKSIEDNFITAIDYSQTAIRLAEKVRRLSLHFGNAEYATPPTNLRLSQVRSLAFFGLFKSIPSIVEFKLLQVLFLQLWADYDDKRYYLTGISELFRLRYLRIKACHWIIELPMQMQQLKNLATLEIEARVSEVPSDIVDLPGLLYLCLPSECELPHGIGHMTSLRTLGNFNLSSNSTENVMNLGELTNLQDLLLTCSTVQPDNLKNNMQCLGSILSKISNLKSLTLLPSAANTNTLVAGASSNKISCDLSSVSTPPTLLQRLELLPRICIFSVLPKWIKELGKLCILKIEIMELSSNDIDILEGLPALTALSLYVSTAPSKSIVIDKTGFPILKYFKFRCTAPCLSFAAGAMLNVRRLRLGFNVNRMKQYSPVDAGFEHLTGLKEIYAKIGYAGADKSDRTTAESTLRDAISKNPNKPIVIVKLVDCIFYDDEEKSITTQQENQAVIAEEGLDKQHGIQEEVSFQDTDKQADNRVSLSSELSSHVQNPGEDKSTTTQEENRQIIEKQTEIVEEDSKEKHGIQAVSRTYMPSESILHLQNPDEDKGTTTQEEKQQVLEMQAEIVEEDSSEQYGIQEKRSREETNKPADSGTSVASESSLHMQNPGEDKSTATHMGKHGALQEQDVTMEKDTNEQLGNQEKDPREDINQRGDNRSMPSESSSHLRKPEEVKSMVTKEDEHQRLEKQDVVVVEGSKLRHGFQESSVDDIDKRRANRYRYLFITYGEVPILDQDSWSWALVSQPYRYRSYHRGRSSRPNRPGRKRSSRPNRPDNSTAGEDEEHQSVEIQHRTHERNTEKDTRKQTATRTSALSDSTSYLWKPGTKSWRPKDAVHPAETLRGMTYVMKQQMKLEGGVKNDIEFIKREMELMTVIIEDNDENNQGALQETWVLQLQELVYDIEDYMCIYTRLRNITLWGRALAHMSHIKHLKDRIKSLRKWQQTAKSTQTGDRVGTASTHSPSGVPRYYPPEANHLVGIDGPKDEIVRMLSAYDDGREPYERRVISIVGPRGVGKTALASAVYSAVSDYFDHIAWVVASECNSAGDLLNNIIIQFQPHYPGKASSTTSDISLLREILREKRCLVVIDQVERAEVWYHMERAFPNDGTYSRIIVTTSIHSVAAAAATSTSRSYLYTMRGLGDVESEELFWREVYGCRTKPAPALIDGSESIFRKCEGLPLALVSVAEYMRGHRTGRIGKFGNYLGLGGAPEAFREMNRVLGQCYDSLPDSGHRKCLLSLSIFPQGHPINRKSLIRRWIAEGLISGDGARKDEEIAGDRFDELIDRNIIEPVLIGNDSKVKRCRVHGAMLEFIVNKSVSKDLVTLIRKDEPLPNKKAPRPVRRLSVHDGTAETGSVAAEIGLSAIRSLTIINSELFDFQRCKLLRVLDLEGCRGLHDRVVRAICKLLFLKYLSLRGSDVDSIPKTVRKLYDLETLDVRETRVKMLPIEAIMLPRLAHLFGQFELPHELKDGKKKSKLQEFFSEKSRLQTLSGFVIDENSGFEPILLHMRLLRKVKIWCKSDISWSEELHIVSTLRKRFTDNNTLESLSIDFNDYPMDFLNDLQAPCLLRSIKLRGKLRELTNFITSLDSTLLELQLSNTGLSWIDLSQLQSLRCLEYLKLADGPDGFWNGWFVVHGDGFPSLLRLCFEAKDCLPAVRIEHGAMPKLTSLQLLGPVPDVEGIEHLEHLDEVVLHSSVPEDTLEEYRRKVMGHKKRPKLIKQATNTLEE